MPFDFAAVSAPFRMQPALRRIAPGTPQLTPAEPGSRALREKLAVLSAFAQQALLASPDFDARPALRGLTAHAVAEHPSALASDGEGRVSALRLGWSVAGSEVRGDGPAGIGACLRALPDAWRRPALLCLAFVEDFAVVDAATGRIPWLAVCLPSHWAPENQVGRRFGEIHAPVADNRLLLAAADRLTRLVTGSERWERFVWTITRQSRLHAHPDRCDPAPWPPHAGSAELAAAAYFRTERQTFIPVPGAAQAVFTIEVDVRSLAVAIDAPGRAAQLHAALGTMSDAVLAYRGLTEARTRLLDWLAESTRDDPAAAAVPAASAVAA